jgi:hypothetical protein
MKRVLAWIVCVGLLGVTAYFGFTDGVDDFADAGTTAQLICTIAVTSYAVTAALALIGLFWRKRWAVYATLAWTISMTVAGMLAPAAWGDVPVVWWVTLLSGAVIAGIGAGVTRLVAYLVTSSRAATSRT